jgi:hypothetical protein
LIIEPFFAEPAGGADEDDNAAAFSKVEVEEEGLGFKDACWFSTRASDKNLRDLKASQVAPLLCASER